MRGYDLGAFPLLVAVFGGAWLRERAYKVKLRHGVAVTLMAYLTGLGLWLVRRNR